MNGGKSAATKLRKSRLVLGENYLRMAHYGKELKYSTNYLWFLRLKNTFSCYKTKYFWDVNSKVKYTLLESQLSRKTMYCGCIFVQIDLFELKGVEYGIVKKGNQQHGQQNNNELPPSS